MDQDKQQRHVKVINGGEHRTGVKRAAVKPHKRTTEAEIKQVISAFMGNVRAGSLSQTFYGDTIAKNAAALCANFGIPATDEPYLLLDPTKSGKAGMLLASSGVHLADGRGGTAAISWKELGTSALSYKNGMLVIGQSGVSSRDGQTLLGLLQQIQAKVAK